MKERAKVKEGCKRNDEREREERGRAGTDQSEADSAASTRCVEIANHIRQG